MRIFDRNGGEIYGARAAEHLSRLRQMPPLVVNSLLFIEDRYLFDAENPERNAAIEWNRFALAARGRSRSSSPIADAGGGSTLATQIEKFRHSRSGRTDGVGEKLRQMLTASARAYSDGPNTMQAARADRHELPELGAASSRPGYGEVLGIPEALWVGSAPISTMPTKYSNPLRAMPPNWRARRRSIGKSSRCSWRNAARAMTCSMTGPRSTH